MTTYKDCALVYVASKHTYVSEAIQSSRSARYWLPGITVYLKVTQSELIQNGDSSHFDQTIVLNGSEDGFMAKSHFIEGLDKPRVLFLDGDTHVCGELREAFELLDHFDIAVSHAPLRFSQNIGRDLSCTPKMSPIDDIESRPGKGRDEEAIY